MKLVSLIILTFTSFLSCSRINVASQDYYRHGHVRHGIIPLSSPVVQKLNEASVARGKAIYEASCQSCHGKFGKGDGPEASNHKFRPADLHKLARDVKDFKFFMSISVWQGDMPGWKDKFNESDREDLVAYIKTFK